MAETLTLTTPITPMRPSISGYSIWSIYFGYGEDVIRVVVEDNNGHRLTAVYADEDKSTTTRDLMIALNKVNLAAKSLQRRVLEQLVIDGKMPSGAVSGFPK